MSVAGLVETFYAMSLEKPTQSLCCILWQYIFVMPYGHFKQTVNQTLKSVELRYMYGGWVGNAGFCHCGSGP